MANLGDQSQNGSFEFERIRLDIQQRILRMKLMLWAGDYLAARSEIEQAYFDYRRDLVRALQLKSRLMSAYREQLPDPRTKEKIFSGQHLSSEEDTYYILSPLANTIATLDRRVAEILGLRPVFEQRLRKRLNVYDRFEQLPVDTASGFRIAAMNVKPDQWQIKLYKIESLPIDVNALLSNLQVSLRSAVRIIEVSETEEGRKLPLTIRSFSNTGFLEATFYDNNKFMANLTVTTEHDVSNIIHLLLHAVVHSQRS